MRARHSRVEPMGRVVACVGRVREPGCRRHGPGARREGEARKKRKNGDASHSRVSDPLLLSTSHHRHTHDHKHTKKHAVSHLPGLGPRGQPSYGEARIRRGAKSSGFLGRRLAVEVFSSSAERGVAHLSPLRPPRSAHPQPATAVLRPGHTLCLGSWTGGRHFRDASLQRQAVALSGVVGPNARSLALFLALPLTLFALSARSQFGGVNASIEASTTFTGECGCACAG